MAQQGRDGTVVAVRNWEKEENGIEVGMRCENMGSGLSMLCRYYRVEFKVKVWG